MPLNTNTYLTSQGWGGAGVPLDGAGGRGLKKPLSIPQKRSLTGVGKDRDRATEWWDSIFSAGAKNLSIGGSKDSSAATTPTPEAKVTVVTTTTTTRIEGMSLASLAKREHAKKMLMSSFIRGEVLSSKEVTPQPEPIAPKAERKAAKQAKAERKAAKRLAKVEKALKKEAKTAKKADKELKAKLKQAKREEKKSKAVQASGDKHDSKPKTKKA